MTMHAKNSIATDTASAASQLYARDQLLEQLLQSNSQEEMGSIVAENVLVFDQSFWMRLALRHDEADSQEQKDRISSLAATVASLVEGIVKASEGQAVESGQVLQTILKAAADDAGEWHMPLKAAQEASFEKAVDDNSASLDEALLSNIFAWMRKCKDDGLVDVYLLLQSLLQKCAARALVKTSGNAADKALNEVIMGDPKQWEQIMMRQMVSDGVSHSAFATALQKRMEGVVLKESSGSHSQRVQAEFLKEIEDVSKKVKLPGSQ